MTPSEARIFLNADHYDDVSEAYEGLLFEQKQFFLQKPCIPRVYFSKLERIAKFEEAAVLLGLEQASEVITDDLSYDFKSDNLKQVFMDYVSNLNALKIELSNAVSFSELRLSVKKVSSLFRAYSSCWPAFQAYEEGLVLSLAPDQVAFFDQLVRLEQIGICTFADLINSNSSEADPVKKESMRLKKLYSTFDHA